MRISLNSAAHFYKTEQNHHKAMGSFLTLILKGFKPYF
jgi:hypothetical protein